MADYTVEKLGSEDINFGTGTFNRTSRVTPGSTVSISQINAEDIPIIDSGSNFTATEVESALAEMGKRTTVQVRIPPNGSVSAGQPIIVLLLTDRAITVQKVAYVPDLSFKESSTDYTNFIILNRGVAGIGATVVTSYLFNGNLTLNTANQPIDFGTIDSPSIADGEVLALYVDPVGARGTAFLPQGVISVEYTW